MITKVQNLIHDGINQLRIDLQDIICDLTPRCGISIKANKHQAKMYATNYKRYFM